MHAALQAFFNSDLFNQVVVVLLVVMSVLAWAMMRGKRRQLKAAIRKDASLDRRYRGSAHPACLYVQAQGKFLHPDTLAALGDYEPIETIRKEQTERIPEAEKGKNQNED